MSILIKGVTVLSHDGVLNDKNVFIDDGKISYIGEKSDFTADTVLDGSRRVLMPGLVNAHTHAPMTLFRSYAEGLPLEEWLFNKIFPAEDKMTAQDAYEGTMLAIAEMLASGTTTFSDMYMFTEEMIRAAEETGIGAYICRGLSCFENVKSDYRLEENIKTYKKYHNKGLITVGFGIHAVYTCTPEYIRGCAQAAKELGASIHIHLSETKKEVDECIAKYGKTPTRLMYEHGAFDVPCKAAHCVWITDEDLRLLSEKGVTAVVNPSSNLKLGSGIAEPKRLSAAGMGLALGTDGASSNNNLNMMEEMHLCGLLYGFEADKALKIATGTGDIKVGMRADVILVNIDKPHFYPMHDVTANLVYSAQGSDVESTIVNGRLLYHKGEYKTLDVERICFNAASAAKRICS